MKKVCLLTLFSLLLCFISRIATYGTLPRSELTGPEIWEKVFVPELHKKFHQEIEATYQFEGLISQMKGRIVLDHGATRTANLENYSLIERVARAFGLEPQGYYTFPDKHLTAIDYQLPHKNSFKWFSTLIKYDEFSPEVSQLIQEDIIQSPNILSENSEILLSKLEAEGTLSPQEASQLVKDIVYHFCSRQGPPLKEKSLKYIARESPETANALLLGPDFNHIAYSLNDLDIKEWYGIDVISVLEKLLRQEGFELLPKIQGEATGPLRQTSTKAQLSAFDLLTDDNELTQQMHRSKFIEFIQRQPSQDSEGQIVFEGTHIKPFSGFLAANAFKIYESTTD